MFILAAAQSISLGSTGWTTVDLTGAPYNVPSSASFAVVRVVYKTGGIVEFRKTGSTHTVVTTTNTKNAMADAVVPLSAGGIDIYSSVTTGAALDVYLIGYTAGSEGVAFANPIEIPSAVVMDNDWHTVDTSAYIPSDATWAVIQISTNIIDQNDTFATGQRAGITRVRKFGTTVPDIMDDGIYTWANNHMAKCRTQWFLAPITADGKFDVYSCAKYNVGSDWKKLYLLGYLKSGSHNAAPAFTTFTDAAAWNTETDSSANYASILGVSSDGYMGNGSWGWRGGGSADTILSTTSSGDTDSHIGMAIVAQDGSKNFDLYANNATGPSTIYWYTLGWLDAPTYELSETFAATDEVVQDLYTKDISETFSAADALVIGDTWSDTIAETNAVTDTVVEDFAYGRVALEFFTAEDAVEGEFIIDVISAESKVYVRSNGTGQWGDAGIPETYSSIEVSQTAETLWGDIGDGSGSVYSLSSGEGLQGDISDAYSYIYTTSEGTGNWGGIGDPGLTASVYVGNYRASTVYGIAGEGTSEIYVTSTGTGYEDNITGTGTSYIRVSHHADGVVITGIAHNEVVWSVFPVNISKVAVSRYNSNYSSLVVVGKDSYAIRGGNIVKIGARSDGGTAIAASIAKQDISVGTNHRKQPTDVYMHMMSEGSFTMDIQSDRGAGQVSITDNIPRRHGCKSNLPRGVSGRDFSFNLQNVAGAYFEIDEFEFLCDVSEGRRGRQTGV